MCFYIYPLMSLLQEKRMLAAPLTGEKLAKYNARKAKNMRDKRARDKRKAEAEAGVIDVQSGSE